jgi:hypothetical protein
MVEDIRVWYLCINTGSLIPVPSLVLDPPARISNSVLVTRSGSVALCCLVLQSSVGDGQVAALGTTMTRLTAKALMYLVLAPSSDQLPSHTPLRRAGIDLIGEAPSKLYNLMYNRRL